jgi:hypothetical protein
MSDIHSQMAEELADGLTASVSASGTYSLSGLSGYPTSITNGGYTFANTTITNNGATTGSLGPYTFSAGTNTAPWYSATASSKITLDGADADIEINGISLLKTMQEIQNRLNILQPNTALEKEWQELYELGRKYRELEQQIKDKQATWDRLKAMPPPELD